MLFYDHGTNPTHPFPDSANEGLVSARYKRSLNDYTKPDLLLLLTSNSNR
jgi:hypothetical protein